MDQVVIWTQTKQKIRNNALSFRQPPCVGFQSVRDKTLTIRAGIIDVGKNDLCSTNSLAIDV
jgi:hypothetical protein